MKLNVHEMAALERLQLLLQKDNHFDHKSAVLNEMGNNLVFSSVNVHHHAHRTCCNREAKQ